MEEAHESEQIAPGTKPFMNPATHSKKHSGKKKKKKEEEQKYGQQQGVGRMEEAHESKKTAPGKEAFMKKPLTTSLYSPARSKDLFWKMETEEERKYRQQARDYAKKLTLSYGEEVLRASIVADLYRMVDHMEFLRLDIIHLIEKKRMSLSTEELQMVKDHLEFSAAKLRWVTECTETMPRRDILNDFVYTKMEDVQQYLGRIIDNLAFSAIEKKKNKMEMLEEVEDLINRLEELKGILRHLKHKTPREMVEKWKTAEPLSRMAARLEFSPAELRMLKTEEFYCKQHSPKMERQPVSTVEKEMMVAPEKFSEPSSDEDLKKKRSPDEAVEKEEKDPHDIPEKRKSLYKEPEEQKKKPWEAPELTKKSFVEAVENQLQFWKGSIRFLYEQLEIATNGFRIICHKGSKMLSYEGSLSGKKVFIRRYTDHNKEVLFLAEVRNFSMLHHRNIAKGIGWCCHGGDLFIVEEFMGNGCLRDYIGEDKPSLPWDVRFKIVHDLASAILYMHEGCYRCVLHGDIDSANVLLDSDYCAKLSSFRELQFVYKDTESSDPGKREDVYSFGIVVLEIATGRKPDYYTPLWARELVSWVQDLFFSNMDGIFEVADKRLKQEFDLSQMEKLISIGLCCTQALDKQIPSMQEVVQFLEFGTPLPTADETNVPFVSRISSPRGQMSPDLHGETSLANETIGRREQSIIDDHMKQLTLGDKAISATEDDDIGIPEDYNCSGPMNKSQVLVMNGLISTLYTKIKDGAKRNHILQSVRSFTESLVQLRFPISDWKPLAHYILHVSRMIEDQDVGKCGETLSDVQEKLAQHLATIEERAKIGWPKENLASTEQELPEPTSISISEKGELRKFEEMAGESLLTDEKIEVLNNSISPRIETIEYIKFAISILHESMLSQVSTFPFDGK